MKGFKKSLVVSGLLLSTILLTSCQLTTGKQVVEDRQKERIELTHNTWEAYDKNKSFAMVHKDALEKFVFEGVDPGILSEDFETTGNFSFDTDAESFEVRSVVYSDYFTALGANAIKAVTVYQGVGARLLVTAYFKDDKLIVLDTKKVEGR